MQYPPEPKNKNNVYMIYALKKGHSQTTTFLPELGMDVLPGQPFPCALSVAKELTKRYPDRIFKIEPNVVEDPKPALKITKKEKGKK